MEQRDFIRMDDGPVAGDALEFKECLIGVYNGFAGHGGSELSAEDEQGGNRVETDFRVPGAMVRAAPEGRTTMSAQSMPPMC